MNWPDSPDPASYRRPPLDPRGLLCAETPCVKCGYNLRGQMPDGRCSECGTPVADSIRPDLWRCRSRACIEQVQTGLRLFVASIVCTFSGFFLIFLSAISGSAGPCFTVLSALVIGGLNVAGAASSTSRPDTTRFEDGVSRGLWITAVLQAAAMIVVVLMGLAIIGSSGSELPLNMLMLAYLLMVISTAVLIALLLAHAHRVVARSKLRPLLWTLVLPGLLTAFGTIGVLLGGIGIVNEVFEPAVQTFAIGTLMGLAAWLLTLVPLLIALRSLRLERAISERWSGLARAHESIQAPDVIPPTPPLP